MFNASEQYQGIAEENLREIIYALVTKREAQF